MRVRLSVPVLALLVSVAAPTAAQSGRFDYPQWRGLHRDGSASGFVEPSAWPAALTRQWTVAVGQGYATPLVVGDQVFVFTRRNDDEMFGHCGHVASGRAGRSRPHGGTTTSRRR